MSARRMVRASLLVYGIAAVLAIGWAALAGRPLLLVHPAPWLPLSPVEGHLASLVGGVALAAATVAFTRFSAERFAWARALHTGFRELLGGLDGRAVLVLALASGIGEELFFRGALQPSLGFVGTSLIFGLVHVGPDRRFWVWTPWAVAMGFALGALFEATGSLLGPILAHVWINHENLAFLIAWDPAAPRGDVPGGAPRLVDRRERR